MDVELPKVVVYCDGACQGNPGPGGWAAILSYEGHKLELSGAEKATTNNRMELTAALQALRALKRTSDVTFYTDSNYLVRGATEWLAGWKQRGWRRKEGSLLNADLWQALDEQLGRHSVHWVWVKGHAGNPLNERADQLAVRAIRSLPTSDQG